MSKRDIELTFHYSLAPCYLIHAEMSFHILKSNWQLITLSIPSYREVGLIQNTSALKRLLNNS